MKAPEASLRELPPTRQMLRWRARRGLLENDILVTRFLDAHEASLTETDVAAFHELLDLTDNHLMDLILARVQPAPDELSNQAQDILKRLQQA